MYNQVVIIGRLTKDPEIIEMPSGNTRARICVACRRPFKSRGAENYTTDFLYVTLWEGAVEAVRATCKKGTLVMVKARLETNTYNDKNTGKKSYALNIIGERLISLGQNLENKEEESQNEVDIEPELLSQEEE